MIQTATCPNDAALQQYAEGWSDPASTLEVEEHLTACAKCEERLSLIETARASDGLIESLRLRGQLTCEPTAADVSEPSSSSDAVDSEFQQVLADIREWPLDAATNPDAATDLPKSLGQYELLELIGQGGMAQVYRARHSKLQRTVAIKLLNVPKWQVDRSLARLEREIAVVGQLHHPAIVAATDAGQHDGSPYLVTEFIDGLNLSQLARAVPTGSSPKTADACEAIRVAALGLAHAHSQGVTHRDIKPSNLMIDRQGQVKILDFGLVHLEGWQDEALELTTVGQLLGTLDYMAPEQADKATAVDHRSDVYALGATLFRLLCGRAPYAASLYQSPLEKLRLLAMTDPPKVETLRPDLPSDLAALVDQSLSRDPAKRPPSAAHVAEALVPFCEGAELGAWVQWAIANPPLPLLSETRGQATTQRPVIDLAQVEKQEPETNSGGRGRRSWPWWFAAAAGAAAVWLGIILILDTQKGQLVIESESADVRVTLRKDGQEAETIQLQPGLNQTRVFAGTYEIEIDGPADAYQMDRDTVVIKRGEVVLAKVSRKAADRNLATNDPTNLAGTTDNVPSQVSTPTTNEPTYSGLTYSEWFHRFRAENNPTEKLKAFEALTSFSGIEQIARTRGVLLEYISLGTPEKSILRAADAIQAFDQANWIQLQTALAALPPEKIVKSLHALRILANPTVARARGELPMASISDRVLPYFDLAEHLLVATGATWANEERRDALTGLLDLTRLPYRNADDQAKVVARMWELTKRPEFDNRCWYVVRNDLFWEQFPDARVKIDNAITESIPKTYTVSIDFVETLLALNSVHSRCSDEQKKRIAKDLDRLMLSIRLEHFSSKSSYTQFNDSMRRYSVELFDSSNERLWRSESNSQTDWETGARLLHKLAVEPQRKWNQGSSHFVKTPIVFPDDMQSIVGRSVWRESQKGIGSSHHLIEIVVLTYARFLSGAEPFPDGGGMEHISHMVAPILKPLCLTLSGFGEPGEELVLRTEWGFPESNSSISWNSDEHHHYESIAITREQLSALLISTCVAEAKLGVQPSDSAIGEPSSTSTVSSLPVPVDHESPSDSLTEGPPTNALDTGSNVVASEASNVNEPTYKGYPFSHWAAVFRNDRDADTRVEAFKNLAHFHTSETYVAQSRELFVEAILESHRQESPGLWTILQEVPEVYRLNREQWQRIAASIEQHDPANQPTMLASLHLLANRYPLNDDFQSLHDGFIAYLDITYQIADKHRSRLTPGGKAAVWDAIMFSGKNAEEWVKERQNANSHLVQDAQSLVQRCVETIEIPWPVLHQWTERNHFEEQPFVRSFVIEALLAAIPTQPAMDIETARFLAIVQRLIPHMTEDQNRTLMSHLETWLDNATMDQLNTPMAGLSRRSKHVLKDRDGRLMFFDRSVNPAGREVPVLAHFSAESDGYPPSEQLVALRRAILPYSLGFATTGERNFRLYIETPPTIGELLISTWVMQQNHLATPVSPRVERLVSDTKMAYDVFWSSVIQHHSSHPNIDQVFVESNRVRVTGPVQLASNLPPAPIDISLNYLSPLDIEKLVDAVWENLGLGSTESLVISRPLKTRVANPKGPRASAELDLTFGSAVDLDKDGKVTKDELFQFFGRCSPLQKLEGITPEIAQGMLLHHFLLTILDRPLPELKLGNASESGESAEIDAEDTEATEMPAESQPLIPAADDSDDPVYSGLKFSEWLRRFRAENNPTEKLNAFKALVSFPGQEHIRQTREALVEYIALGNPDEMILRTADTIHGIDAAGWEQLQNTLDSLPTATAAKVVYSLRLLACPAVKPLRQSASPRPPSSDRVLPYFDLVQHKLATSGSEWSMAERRDILTGLLDLVRLPYRTPDEQMAIETRLWEFTRHPNFDHRCWYVVRNDPFWDRSAEARGKIDAAIIDAIPAQCEVSMEFVEKLLALNSIHSRCTAEQKTTIVEQMDRLMLTVGVQHLRAKSGFADFLDFAGRFEVELFDLPDQNLNRSDSSPKTDWEMGAKQLETFSYARQRPVENSNSPKFPVVFHPALSKIAGERNVWLEFHLQQHRFYYHVVDLVVLTYVRFSDELEQTHPKSGLESVAKLTRDLLAPLMPKLAEIGEPGQNLVLNTSWAFPESSSQIYWDKRATEPVSVVVTREQLSALLISASVDSALRGEQPPGPIWVKGGWGYRTIPLLPSPKSSEVTNDEPESPNNKTDSDPTPISEQQPIQ